MRKRNSLTPSKRQIMRRKSKHTAEKDKEKKAGNSSFRMNRRMSHYFNANDPIEINN